MKSVGEYLAPETSVNSANSVGEYLAPETSVGSANSVGELAEGGVGMAGMPYPPTKTPTDCTDVHRLGGKNAT